MYLNSNNGISKLRGPDNWETWKFQIKVILRSKGWDSALVSNNNAATIDNHDNKAQAVIVSLIEEKLLSYNKL